MGNLITNKKADEWLNLSNGATDVLLSVLLLSGSDLATTEWEKELIIWLAEHDQYLYGRGVVGFDIDEIAWSTQDFDRQKAFFLKTIDLALQRHRWEVLDYDPPYAHEYLVTLRRLVEKYTVEMIVSTKQWDWFVEPEHLSKCPEHNVYIHANGCLICHDSL